MESAASAETGVVDEIIDMDAVGIELSVQRGRRLALCEIGADRAHRARAQRARSPGNRGQAILPTRRQHGIVMLPAARVGELLTQPARGSSNSHGCQTP